MKPLQWLLLAVCAAAIYPFLLFTHPPTSKSSKHIDCFNWVVGRICTNKHVYIVQDNKPYDLGRVPSSGLPGRPMLP